MPWNGMPSVERSRPVWGQGLRATRGAQELAQPPKTANVEILGGHFAGAQHSPDELSAAIHRPERGVTGRGLGLQSLKLKCLALPGDGSLMVAHWAGLEEAGGAITCLHIVRCSTRIDNRRERAGTVVEADSRLCRAQAWTLEARFLELTSSSRGVRGRTGWCF
jgi:hypothetical protein